MRRAMTAVVVMLTVGVSPLLGAGPSAADSPAGSLVGVVPVSGTPHVLDGDVNSIAQVGNTIILGGSFTQARNNDSETVLTRNRLVAFDITTKQISTTFVPSLDGLVNVVLPTGDGQTIWVGGDFRNVSGVPARSLVKLRVADGSVVTTFKPQTVAGKVTDLKLSNGRLWVAGAFTNIANTTQGRLATLNPTTGSLTSFFRGTIAGLHRGGTTTVLKIDLTPSGDRLVAIGNFDTLNGVKQHQMFLLDTSGATAVPADFHTTFYEAGCSTSFESYMRDVDISPDGQFAVVSTTGAYGGAGIACDSTARFETHSTGANVRPSWINNTGGDTTYAVEITDSVVYTGGHARWQNNAFAADFAGQGAVSRPGIAALDPANGLPLSWNPGRARGVGVFDFLHTADGLWVASDTDRIGADFYRGRIALLPHHNGTQFPAIHDTHLPNDVYLAYPLGGPNVATPALRVNAGGPQIAGTPVWSSDSSGNGYHNSGLTRNSYSAVGSVDATVPAGTPSTIFSTEIVGRNQSPNQSWNIPVTAGDSLEVRLYFANRSNGTDGVGERRFNVDLEGTRVLTNFDVVAATGNNRGTMRSFQIASDGNVDLDLGQVTNFPLINGIEIMRNEPGPPTSPLLSRAYDGSVVGADSVAPAGAQPWSTVRGAFMLNGNLYTAWNDGTFVKQSFDGTTYGPAIAVDTASELTPLTDWVNDIKAATSMFYDNGRIYFTKSADDNLYYRYFTAESDVIGAQRLVATGSVAGVTFSQVRSAFVADGKLYYANKAGDLVRMDWTRGPLAGGPAAGSNVTVSGPAVDGRNWYARALFLFQGADGQGAGMVPTASYTFACTSLTCEFDGTGSSAVNAQIASYAWDFGDGSTGSGATPSHTYADSGTRQVTLTVTTDKGDSAATTKDVAVTRVNKAPTASFTQTCTQLACAFDATGSSDPDGEPLTYAWDFGDGGTGSGANPQHAYAAAGTFPVTLTVSDGSASDTEARDLTIVAGAVQHVASVATGGNRTNHTLTVPATVQEGDRLVLLMTTNATSTTVADPAGWTVVQSVDGNTVRGRAWTRLATAADAGTITTVTTSATTKATLTLGAYRNEHGAVAVASSAASIVNSSTAQVTTPEVQTTGAGSWLVSYWAEKSSTDGLTWTLPNDVTGRANGVSTGTGKVSSVLADSNGTVPAGAAGGLTATPSVSVSRAVAFSIVLAPQ